MTNPPQPSGQVPFPSVGQSESVLGLQPQTPAVTAPQVMYCCVQGQVLAMPHLVMVPQTSPSLHVGHTSLSQQALR